MKNILIIDGAVNCAYDVFQTTEENFALIFPGEGQDIAFIDEVVEKLGEEKADKIFIPLWEKRVDKKDAMGIHGTLFYELENKKGYYPNRRESDLDQKFKI